MTKKGNKSAAGLSRRLSFPDEERRFAWMPALLDAFAIIDTGVAVAVRNVEKKQGKKLACGKGCGACCVHQKDLPLYPHEIVGIYWFVREKLSGAVQETIGARLAGRSAALGCPFLVDGSCAIHPVRPFGCRQFNVFTTPCAPGEDPYHTRRDDVLEPIPEYLDRAFGAVVPLYNLQLRGDAAVRMIRSQIMNLLSYDWSKLAEQLGKKSSTS